MWPEFGERHGSPVFVNSLLVVELPVVINVCLHVCCRELPSIYHGKSGLFKGVEEMWEKWSIRSSNASLQVWMGSSEELGIMVAGLRIGQHSKENSRASRRVT